jgi:hypothetical protein
VKVTLPGIAEIERMEREQKRKSDVPIYSERGAARSGVGKNAFKFGDRGYRKREEPEWLVEFDDTREADKAVARNPSSKMPCKIGGADAFTKEILNSYYLGY